MSLPACLLATALSVALVQESCGYHPLWPDDRQNLAEAAATRNVPDIARLLRDGADAHARYAVRPGLIDDTAGRFTPLEAAVAVDDEDIVRLLLAHGALDEAQLHRLWCGAHSENVRRALIAVGADGICGTAPCTTAERDDLHRTLEGLCTTITVNVSE